jgi:hypothetical protein
MSRRMGMVCAALLCATVGCVGNSLLAPWFAARGYKQVVAEPCNTVEVILETGLHERGIKVLTKRDRGEIRMAGQTKSGKVFCFYLTPQRTEKEDKTLVWLCWDRDADEQFQQTVIAILNAPLA